MVSGSLRSLPHKRSGLRVDKSIDERQNIESASRGAAKYLQKNNLYFNNWLHALQAYQMGAGGALKVLGEGDAGAKRMTITKKTYWYVKKYLAHKIAFEDAVEEVRNDVAVLSEYSNFGGKTLKEVASRTGVTEEVVEKYNTWLLARRIPTDKEYTVVVPDGKVRETPKEVVTANTAPTKIAQPTATKPQLSSRKVLTKAKFNGLPGVIGKGGMSVDAFADWVGIEAVKLMTYNDMLPHDQIMEGQVYYLKPKRSKGRVFYHTVEEGENAWIVSQKYAIKVSKLLKMNRIDPSQKQLEPGRILWLKKTRPANMPVEYRGVVGE